MLRRFVLLAGLAIASGFATLLLLSVGPRFVGFSSFVVYGASMEPAIPRGSVAVAKPVSPEAIRVGDIIVYRKSAKQMPTVHRVVAIEEENSLKAVRTKGDANDTEDPGELALSGKGSTVVYTVPYVGFILHAWAATWSMNFLIRLPAVLLAGFLLWMIWRPSRPLSNVSMRGAEEAS